MRLTKLRGDKTFWSIFFCFSLCVCVLYMPVVLYYLIVRYFFCLFPVSGEMHVFLVFSVILSSYMFGISDGTQKNEEQNGKQNHEEHLPTYLPTYLP